MDTANQVNERKSLTDFFFLLVFPTDALWSSIDKRVINWQLLDICLTLLFVCSLAARICGDVSGAEAASGIYPCFGMGELELNSCV